jgi:hypothetical protein
MTPAYFNPAAQPDTETQYRRGGKVNKMQKLSVAKKMPRKFGEGGIARPNFETDWMPQAKYASLSDMLKGKRMDDEKKPAPSSDDTPKVYNRPAPVKTESDEDKSAMDAASAMASGSASSYGSQASQDAPKGIKGGENVVTAVKKEAPKRVAPKAAAPKAAAAKAKTSNYSNEGRGSARDTPNYSNEGRGSAKTSGNPNPVSYPKSATGKDNGKTEDSRGIYARGAGRIIPEPLDSGKQPSGPTAPEKARAKRLNDEAEARVAAAKNRKYVSAPATKAKDEYEGMSPSEASIARGEKFKKMLGLKKGGSVKKFAKGGNVDLTMADDSYKQGPKKVTATKAENAGTYANVLSNVDRSRVPVRGDTKASGDKVKATKGFARGGGIESKGKTQGKIVKKFAKGGMARGYGISKVTNKTKYC